ncbi:rhomboid family intramembrane serine protease [Bacillus andreraoultii]|uniref:rhomboid family intramembrane serine protease n=1 Tax=Bacillus andreraoultii TaxID=1499685 RepID=UPI00053B8125|nr:rhomboid family intramembrane serine protease [Bacillus andreraoultii]
MGYREDYLFWEFVHFLIEEEGYRLIKHLDGQQEIWLENLTDKQFPLIRLVRKDIDWSNWLKADMKQAILSADGIRKMLYRRNFQVLNVYFSTLPPVDSYEQFVNRPVQIKNIKTTMQTVLFDGSRLNESIQFLSQVIGKTPFKQIKDDYDEYEVDLIKRIVYEKSHEAEKREQKLFNRTKPFFTNVMLVIIALVFVLLEMSGGSTNPYVLYYFGAKENTSIVNGEWWRFITPMFLHIGFFHLFMNSLALYYLGTAVEKIYGRFRFTFIYLFAGFFGTLASFIFSPHLSAGASGAIFGLFGALLYFGLEHKQTFYRTIGPNIIALIVVNIGIGFVIPSIDISGHIGGMVGGFLAAGFTQLPDTKAKRNRYVFLVLAVLLTVAGLLYGYHFPNFN